MRYRVSGVRFLTFDRISGVYGQSPTKLKALDAGEVNRHGNHVVIFVKLTQVRCTKCWIQYKCRQWVLTAASASKHDGAFNFLNELLDEYSDRAFLAPAARVWNSLPASISIAISIYAEIEDRSFHSLIPCCLILSRRLDLVVSDLCSFLFFWRDSEVP